MDIHQLHFPFRRVLLNRLELGFGLVFKLLLGALALGIVHLLTSLSALRGTLGDGVGLALHDLATASDEFVLGLGRIRATQPVAVSRLALARSWRRGERQHPRKAPTGPRCWARRRRRAR